MPPVLSFFFFPLLCQRSRISDSKIANIQSISLNPCCWGRQDDPGVRLPGISVLQDDGEKQSPQRRTPLLVSILVSPRNASSCSTRCSYGGLNWIGSDCFVPMKKVSFFLSEFGQQQPNFWQSYYHVFPFYLLGIYSQLAQPT